MTLLTELRDSLVSMKCPHHWVSFINLFDIKRKRPQLLARKVERIIRDPAPFSFDDGCCCLSPCCLGVPLYNFIRRSSQQLHVEYEEITVDGEMIRQVQNPVCHPSSTPTHGVRGDPSSCSSEQECQRVHQSLNNLWCPFLQHVMPNKCPDFSWMKKRKHH